METRPLEVQIGWTVIGRTTIEVPAHLSLQEAIQYAEDHIQEIRNPHETAVYIPDSDFIEENGCRWKDKMPEETEKKLSSDDSKISVWLIPTNEELMIARDAYQFVK